MVICDGFRNKNSFLSLSSFLFLSLSLSLSAQIDSMHKLHTVTCDWIFSSLSFSVSYTVSFYLSFSFSVVLSFSFSVVLSFSFSPFSNDCTFIQYFALSFSFQEKNSSSFILSFLVREKDFSFIKISFLSCNFQSYRSLL